MAKQGPWRKRPDLFTLIALEIITLFVVTYQIQVEPHLSLLEKSALTIFSPFQSLSDRTFDVIDSKMSRSKSIEQLERENAELRENGRIVKQLRLDLEELRKQNLRLRDMIDLAPAPGWGHVVAEVTGQAAHRGDHMFTINKGSKHGIRPDQGVITPEGVVGIVWEVSHFYAKVMAINNTGSAVAAMVQNSRYQDAYITGTGSGGQLENVPNFSQVQVGDKILTSGHDFLFPPGLPIGMVISRRPASDMFQQISVRFDVHYQDLDEVMVMLPPVEARP